MSGNVQKVALISWYLSGTNLLRCFLNSHPDIFFHKELFCIPAGWHPSEHGKGDYAKALDTAFDHPKPVVGVDIKYNQLNNEIIQYCWDNKVAVIHLTRDPLHTVWHTKDKGSSVTYETLLDHIEAMREHRLRVRHAFEDLKILEISYEEMSLGRRIEDLALGFERNLLQFLEVPYRKLILREEYSTKPLVTRNKF